MQDFGERLSLLQSSMNSPRNPKNLSGPSLYLVLASTHQNLNDVDLVGPLEGICCSHANENFARLVGRRIAGR